MVCEVDLHDFIRKSKHDGVLSLHPLLHVDGALGIVLRFWWDSSA